MRFDNFACGWLFGLALAAALEGEFGAAIFISALACFSALLADD